MQLRTHKHLVSCPAMVIISEFYLTQTLYQFSEPKGSEPETKDEEIAKVLAEEEESPQLPAWMAIAL